MIRLKSGALYCVAMGALPTAALAQVPFTISPSNPQVPTAEMVGTGAVDFIQIHSPSLGFPLRFGGVVANSETVDLNGRTLRKGDEYTVDYGSSMVCLL